jgi:hypothetical protein
MAKREDEVPPLARQYFPVLAVAAAATAKPKSQNPSIQVRLKFQLPKCPKRLLFDFEDCLIGTYLGFGNWVLGFLGRVGFLGLPSAGSNC